MNKLKLSRFNKIWVLLIYVVPTIWGVYKAYRQNEKGSRKHAIINEVRKGVNKFFR